ncbi:MAG: UbiH/UbiF/VisC/COQ6 family ubiquinone biosynthesis hydroxylase [Gammaproteobacteria bacterium]
MAQHYEVAIVGGGMVGATTAAILAKGGIRVALLDAQNPPRQWPEHSIDIRVSALTKASQAIFEALGVWPEIRARGAGPYRDMRVFDASGDGMLHFDCAATEYDELGHIVENRITVAELWNLLEKLPSATLLCPAAVTDLLLNADGRRLLLQDGSCIDAELVIAADGRDSELRKMVGIATSGWEYRQSGLVATVSTSKSHQLTAWQRFLPEGPLAFLPLYNGQCSIVWTLSTASAQQHLALSEREFLRALEAASAGILGAMLDVGPRAAFPLRFQTAQRYTETRLALLGDAAHAMHPLAGQGANAGLLDAAALGELILKARMQGRPIASQHVLRAYERWRKGDNLGMQAGMDVLKRTFTASSQPLIRLRSTGMNRIDRTQPLKDFFNRYAMGLRDDLPLLAQGLPCWQA